MGYLRPQSSQQPQQAPRASFAPVSQPQETSKPIPNINLDPTNPVETVAGAVGGLFQGAVGAVAGAANIAGGIPVIGDVGRAIGGALGAFGEVGIEGAKVKDVLKGGLELASIPGKVVSTGAAAVRASGIFGPPPEDVKQMMSSGKNFFDITQHLVSSNRAFSDNMAANLGFSLVTDPLNFIPIAKPFTLAKQASRLAKVEAAALTEAQALFKAGGKTARYAIPDSAPLAVNSAKELGAALKAARMIPEDIAFLDKWRVGASLYDATIGKLGSKFDSLVSAMQVPVFIAASKVLKDAPKQAIEGIAALGRKDLADNLAKSYGRGLSQSLVFSISKLFTKGVASQAEAEADYVLKVIGQAKKQADNALKSGKDFNAKESVIATLRRDGVVSGGDTEALKLVDSVWEVTDATRREVRRSWINARAESDVSRVGSQAAGDYRTLERVGGLRRSDAALEAQGHLAEGAYKYERISVERQRQLFIEKGAAAISGNGREAVTAALSGVSSATSPESIKLLEKLWDDTISKLDDSARARHIQTMEISAYGNQATNAAILRSAMVAIKSGNAAKLIEITGKQIGTKEFKALRDLIDTPEGSKLVRLNLVKADTLTKERMESLLKVLDDSPEISKAADLSALPEELAAAIKAADGPDAIAAAVANYFPDLNIMVGAADSAVAKELVSALDDMLKSGHYVTLASPDELGLIAKVLDQIAPGASKATIKAIEAGKYTLGFSPESGVIRRTTVKAGAGGIDVVAEHISPFLDSTEHLVDSALDISADSFARSGIRRMADKWLSPISSKVIEKQQLENSIRLAVSVGGSELSGRRLFAAINELSLKTGKTPRALAMDENALRDVMQKSLGAKVFDDLLMKNGGDARKVLMKMYLGTTDVVGKTQAFTGSLKVRFPQLAVLTDFIYPTLKFKLNPQFYIQEAIESPFFNRLRAIDRELTTGQFEVKYGWTRNLPFVQGAIGEKLGLAKRTGVVMDPELAAMVLGAPGAALRADLDNANTIILLQGNEAAKIAATSSGLAVEGSLIEMIKGGGERIYRTVVNPYPMKEGARNQMALSLALDDVADKIRFKFPEQWVAATKIYKTNDARSVMLQLLRDAKNGYINPVRTINAARPRGFAFASKGSIEAASKAKSSVDEFVKKFSGRPLTAEDVADARAQALKLKDVLEESSSLGNDVFSATDDLDKIIAAEAGFEKSIPKLTLSMEESLTAATAASKDFPLLQKALKMHYTDALRGFTMEKVSASLLKHRSYGTDFPGLEQVISKLRKGVSPGDLSADDVRALKYGVNTLIDVHGPEEVLLGAFREALKDTSEVANRIHFYNPNRSALERTLNHPYLGYYPLSYTIGKIVPEFARAAFVKMPFSTRTRPFAGYEMIREAQNHIAMQSELDPKFGEFVSKSDTLFAIKQLFPAVPGDISVGGPRWVNKSLEQFNRSQKPAVGNRPVAQFDPGYVMRSIADQAQTQSAYGVLERTGGAVSEIWDWFEGIVPWNESKKP